MGIRNFNGNVEISYLKESAKILQDIKETSYQMMDLSTNYKVLDIGCGPGIDVNNISKLVGANGKAYGLDNDREMIDEAIKNYDRPNIEFIKGDIGKIPFPDEYFNAVRADRLFQVLPPEYNADEVLKEMIRVTQKEGMIVIVDTDWGSASVDYENYQLNNRLLDFFPIYAGQTVLQVGNLGD